MIRILCLETSAARCSVALYDDDQLVAYRSTDEDRAHSRKLAIFIKEVLDEANSPPASLDAVAYSAGPGSYTGLRVGLSSAKGLAFSLDIPMIAVSTALVFLEEAREKFPADRYLTLQDARRMEAYVSLFDPEGKLGIDDDPTILDEEWASGILSLEGMTVLTGTGALKTQPLFGEAPNVRIFQAQPDARYLIRPALEAWREQRFENILLAEPKYVKAPNITTPKRKTS